MSGTADLYTSSNGSQTFGNEQPTTDVQEVIQAQKAEIARLMPAADDILDIIAEEVKAVSDIRSYYKTLGDNPTANKIQKEYRARELYIEFLQRLAQTISDKVTTAKGATNE